MKMEWVKTPGRYADGETLKVGLVSVARVYNPVRSRSEGKTYMVNMLLPGFKCGSFDAQYETIERAKLRAERAVKSWFEWVNTNG